MHKLVLIRHGESVWNKRKIFTGWTDVDLTAKGIADAKRAGRILKRDGYTFDIAYTSRLRRGIWTLWWVLDAMDLLWIPVRRAWQLNERCYGDLQGLSKVKMAKKVGKAQVFRWRREYTVKPPMLKLSDTRHPRNDIKYADVPRKSLPSGESLQDTVARVLPYWNKVVVPEIKKGKKVLIAAHGNSLRALVKYLDHIPADDVPHLEIPTGIPLVYELDNKLRPLRHYYLGTKSEVKKGKRTHKRMHK